MRTMLAIILFSPLAFAQHMILVQDTTALPTTNLYEGRLIGISNNIYQFQRGAWFFIKTYGVQSKDSITAPVDTTAGHIATQTMTALKLSTSAVKSGAYLDTTGFIYDSCAFTTTGVRVAVYHPGVLSTSIVTATIRLATDASTFLAADVPAVWCKKDSIIVKRFASGTSGQKYDLTGKK